MGKHWKTVCWYAALWVPVLFIGTQSAQAQLVPTPGTVETPLRKPAIEAPAGRLPETVVPKPVKPSVPAGGPQIPIRNFIFNGNTLFSDEQLLAVISQFKGKRLTLLEIYEVSDKLSDFYRSKGYKLASVVVPAQKISTGTVRFEVIEGRVGAIHFKGNARYSSEFLRHHLDSLLPGDVLTEAALEQELLFLNDMPGLTARAVIQPGAEYGAADLVIHTQETRTEGNLRLNNYGRKGIGEWRLEGDFALNNPLERGDRLEVSLVHSQGASLRHGRLRYSHPVGVRGARVAASYSRFLYDVITEELGPTFVGRTLAGDGNEYRVDLSYPWLRSRREDLIFGVALSRNESGQSGSLVLPGTKGTFVNLLSASALWNLSHVDNSVSRLTATFSSNFTRNRDGTRNNAQRGKLQVDASHLKTFAGGWSVLGRLNGVASLDPLMDIQSFRIGGPGNVRGFPSAELAGDQGFMASLQLNRRQDVFSGVPTTWRVFADAGMVHRRVPAAGTDKTASLSSIGLGLSAQISKRYTVDLEWSKPTNAHRVSDGRQNDRIWAQIGASF